MLISEEELKRRLESDRNIINTLPTPEVKVIFPFNKPKEQKQTPSITGNIAGAVAAISGHVADVSKTFGLPESQVRAASRSVEAKAARDKVSELALTRLMQTLGLLTPEKMESSDVKDLSAIAANMSRVYEKLQPKESSISNNVQVTFFMPEQKQTGHYKVIDV